MSEQHKWIQLYEDFLAEPEPAKLKDCLAPLELSILERLQELDTAADGHEERLAIKMPRTNRWSAPVYPVPEGNASKS